MCLLDLNMFKLKPNVLKLYMPHFLSDVYTLLYCLGISVVFRLF